MNWVYEKLVPSKGKILDQIEQNKGLRVCAVDLNIDGHIAVATILEDDGTVVKELARKFIKGYAYHQHRRKRTLGKIATKQSQTKAPETLDNMNANLWEKLKNRERNEGERVSRRLADWAHKWQVSAIVFEHLSNLKPSQEKYSKRSNQKRSYWLKSKVYLRTKDKALNDYGIYCLRVSPKDTSRVWAIDGTSVLRGNQVTQTGFNFIFKGMGKLVLSEHGDILNADLNASRNIGLKYLQKFSEKPRLVTTRFGDRAMNRRVPLLSRDCGTSRVLPVQLALDFGSC
ncbi:IS200/IS605 family element transposase accessory protein TnpB [Gloeocapsa sp. PCC 73106]|uniref:IS200/IS605 family element transposase accessory protein TnpB n=1 Tax=Gloeocapsa sp. PCC 73106 TaxID=102232 RepID=UPI0002AC10C1|nr:IS200/IS605 family element transposase accessory protein TnpB [Gloeocapsa sp. PCC 73106]ELR98560.1 transposase, IS605 OrfB family, central region [Gloeocapsa sp. PCC 73106]